MVDEAHYVNMNLDLSILPAHTSLKAIKMKNVTSEYAAYE